MHSASDSAAVPSAATRGRLVQRWGALLLGALVGAACWHWFSPSLDDTDSALFVAGVERFALAESRPHPPGYPIYILLGKLVALLGPSPRTALAIVSCVSAGICAALLPRFFRALGFATASAWMTALAVLATPLFGLTSCKILTDSAGFAAALGLTIWWLENPNGTGLRYGAGLAVGLGIRPHGILYLLPGLPTASRGRRLLGFFGTLALMVLAVIWVEGAEDFRRSMTAQATMRFKNPGVSLFSPGTGLAGAVERAMRFQLVFFRDVLGVSGAWLKLPVAVLMIGGSMRLWRQSGDSSARRWLLGGAAFYLVFLFLFLPAHPRYFLPIVPLVLGALSFGRAWIAALLLLALLPISASRIGCLHTTPSPSDQAIAWIEEHDARHEVPVLRGHLTAQARVVSPQIVSVRPAELLEDSASAPRLFADWSELPAELRAPAGPYHVLERQVFQRAKLLHDKWSTVDIVLLERR